MTFTDIAARFGVSRATIAERLGVTLAALASAQRLGIQPLLIEGERPAGRPPLVTVERIAEALGAPVDLVDTLTKTMQARWRERDVARVQVRRKPRPKLPPVLRSAPTTRAEGAAMTRTLRGAALDRACRAMGICGGKQLAERTGIGRTTAYSLLSRGFRAAGDLVAEWGMSAEQIAGLLGIDPLRLTSEPAWAIRVAFPTATLDPGASPLRASGVTETGDRVEVVHVEGAPGVSLGFVATVAGCRPMGMKRASVSPLGALDHTLLLLEFQGDTWAGGPRQRIAETRRDTAPRV